MRSFVFFNDTATTEIYTLSLHDALPISGVVGPHRGQAVLRGQPVQLRLNVRAGAPAQPGHAGDGDALAAPVRVDRKSTRLNSSHANISDAVFCLKKKNNSDYSLYHSRTY